MSDLEVNCDSDHEVSENHSKFIDAVRQLDKGQRVRKPERTEPSLEISEFHLVKSGITRQDAVKVEDLAKTLETKGDFARLKKTIAAKNKSKVLRKPLEKPAAERIKRIVGFQNTKAALTKWTGIIARNRTAACVTFPLSENTLKVEPTEDYLKRFRIQSELEKELALVEPEKKSEDEKNDFPLTLKEIVERRKEAAKLRAQQSYKVSKAHRQNKIKSKKFHRIQRKEKIKQSLKEFEQLQKTDPQAALEKLEQLDKARAKERITLRHKSTGQWAKSKQVRAKYDKESRQVLAQQLAISRDLTQKIKKEDSNDEDDDVEQPLNLSNNDKENPWLNTVKTKSEIDEFVSHYRKYYNEKNAAEKNHNETIDRNQDKAQINNQNNNKANNSSEQKINNDNKKKIKILEIKHFSKSDNVLQKIMQKLPKNNGFNENNKLNNKNETHQINLNQEKKSEKMLGSKKLSKNCKINMNLKKCADAKKIKEKKIQAGTSSWTVSSMKSVKNTKNNLTDIDIDDMFDSVEDTIQEKVTKKLSCMKRKLDKQINNDNRKEKKRKNNDLISDIDKLSLKEQRSIKPVIDKPNEETIDFRPSDENFESKESRSEKVVLNNRVIPEIKQAEIDPNKFMNVKPIYVKTVLPDEIAGDEDALDDNEVEDQQQIISEAFADDDVVDEFRKEKQEEIKKDQIEDLNMQLPGWGSWGGKNIKPSSRKKRRFIIKMPKPEPRRDENKGNVVIIEEKCSKIRKHLVSELPFPFTTVKDFEASLRAPLGREFLPEKTFNKLINPTVKTKMGKIIDPMSEDILVKVQNEKQIKLQNKQKKSAKQNKKTLKQTNTSKTSKPNIVKNFNREIKNRKKNIVKKNKKV